MWRWHRPLSVGAFGLYATVASSPTSRDSDWIVRVGLEQAAWAPTIYVSVSGDALQWIDPNTGAVLGHGDPLQVWQVQRVGDRLIAQHGKRRIVAARLVAQPAGAGVVQVGATPHTMRRYRGHLEWVERNGKLLTLNWVRLDDYLKATLPREMPPNFHPEALKAQAIAARSFTLRRLNRHRQWGYDLCDHAPCQVYGGVAAEHPYTNAAVDATAGEVLVFEGRVLDAVYTGNCGGHTAPIEVAMSGTRSIAPLRGVPDTDANGMPYCRIAPNHYWELHLSVDELSRCFPEVGRVRAVQVLQRAPSGHVLQVGVRGARAEKQVAGAQFRHLLGATRVRSLMFDIQPEGNGWKLLGRGWGHGAGMCQWGAQARARAGQNYLQILQAYYPDATVQRPR